MYKWFKTENLTFKMKIMNATAEKRNDEENFLAGKTKLK